MLEITNRFNDIVGDCGPRSTETVPQMFLAHLRSYRCDILHINYNLSTHEPPVWFVF